VEFAVVICKSRCFLSADLACFGAFPLVQTPPPRGVNSADVQFAIGSRLDILISPALPPLAKGGRTVPHTPPVPTYERGGAACPLTPDPSPARGEGRREYVGPFLRRGEGRRVSFEVSKGTYLKHAFPYNCTARARDWRGGLSCP